MSPPWTRRNMRPEHRAALTVGGCVAAMWVATAWAVVRDPELNGPWLMPVAIATALWGLVEFGRRERSTPSTVTVFLRHFMAWVAIAITSLILVRSVATLDGAAAAWATGGPRVAGLIVASGLILFGNAVPTLPSSGFHEREAAVRQHVRRFVAWTVVATGLAVGASWIALDPVVASQTTNRLLALCFLLIGIQQVASLLDPSAPGSPTT